MATEEMLIMLRECLRWSWDSISETATGLKYVPWRYNDPDEYIAAFEPLLFHELKATISFPRRQDEEPKRVLMMTCTESGGFYLPVVKLVDVDDDDNSPSTNDLFILSKSQIFHTTIPEQLPCTYAFAFLESREDAALTLRMHLEEPRLSNMRSMVPELNQEWFILKVCNMTNIIREYVALRSITTLPFKDLILSASNNDPKDIAWKVSQPLLNNLEINYNKTQLDAIRVALNRKGLFLIQGPPGTGKTQTILGILSVILHATPTRNNTNAETHDMKPRRERKPELSFDEKMKYWEKSCPWLFGKNPRDVIKPIDGDDGFVSSIFDGLFPTSENVMKSNNVIFISGKPRVRVLVCSPSNSALDEIVSRLLKIGIRNDKGYRNDPKIVRVGSNAHHSIQSVSMNHLVKTKLEGIKTDGAGRRLDSIRDSILDEATIVFSTLSTSGSLSNQRFDVVIIDEASQAVEPATLIPFATGCKKVILLGDPAQLAATVLSTVAQNFGYGTSLFERLQKAGYPVVMLKTQYRMHPEIRSFPSNEFYQGELEDGPDMELDRKQLWHEYKCFGPFCFFDIHEGRDSQPSGHGGSSVNEDEVEFVLHMYCRMLRIYPELEYSSRVGIISPYELQVKLFNDRFRKTFGASSERVAIETVYGFQGREKDIIFFSCVRAGDEIKSIGDFRGMNVGITRARASILVVGSAITLKRDPHWKKLVENAEDRNCFFKVSKPYNTFFNYENMKTIEVAPSKPVDDATDEMEIDSLTQATLTYSGDGDVDEDGQEDEDIPMETLGRRGKREWWE